MCSMNSGGQVRGGVRFEGQGLGLRGGMRYGVRMRGLPMFSFFLPAAPTAFRQPSTGARGSPLGGGSNQTPPGKWRSRAREREASAPLPTRTPRGSHPGAPPHPPAAPLPRPPPPSSTGTRNSHRRASKTTWGGVSLRPGGTDAVTNTCVASCKERISAI